MLTTLRIKNLALVADLTLEFEAGLSVISGETGAGKSIVIGALCLVLGERADRKLIRSGADTCSVEAVFDVSRLHAPVGRLLEENGIEPCDRGQLIVKRSFGDNGAGRQFINGSPTTLAVLSALGESLVDIHGPYEHQSLLRPARQLVILDAFGKLESLRDSFATIVRRRESLESEMSVLVTDESTHARQIELLRFQLNEITAARLTPGEDVELEKSHRLAANSARLLELSQGALRQLDDDENSLTAQAGALGRTLLELRRLDPDANCLFSLHEQAVSSLRDLQSDLSHYADKLEFDPDRLNTLEHRLNLIQSLKRKYGSSLEEVIHCADQARTKLETLEHRDADLIRIRSELEKINTEIRKTGVRLSESRRKAIPEFSRAISKELAALGFKQSRFEVQLESDLPNDTSGVDATRARPTINGFDTIEFLFSPNPGEPPRPLRVIASSGEMARVMLALKTALAAQDDIPVLIFDEVDANVGGETAEVVGRKMRQLGRQRQVLCITHLAPVAACATKHFVVTKQTRLLRTTTGVERLDEDGRVTELARMLGGQSETARAHAVALLRSASDT